MLGMMVEFPIRGKKLSMSVETLEHLLHKETIFQTIDVYDTEVFGKILLLDGHVQLTDFDEHAYHESLVHIPMLSIPEPKRALIIGGGDGGVLRELCRHQSLESITMVEIDEGVIEASKEILPMLSSGGFDDPRVQIKIEDAFAFVKKETAKYDLIVVDVTDVYEEESGELSEQLFTENFYRDLKNLLSERGFVVTQADNSVFCPYSMEEILRIFKGVFQKVGSYQALVPSFGGFSGYCWASNQNEIAAQLPSNNLGLVYLNEATYALARTQLKFRDNAG
jgi:spermidine synthase